MPRPHVHAPATDLRVACIESAPFGENTYVVFRPGTPACLVIDPGFEPDRVVEAIREEYLYILTHPDFLPMIRNRMDAILEHGEKGVTLH